MGNGLSAGLIQTLGADLAPPAPPARTQFLGGAAGSKWRLPCLRTAATWRLAVASAPLAPDAPELRLPHSPPPPPGVFKTVADAGNFAGPLLAGAIAQWRGLDAACLAAAGAGAAGALYYALCGIETRADPAPPTPAAAAASTTRGRAAAAKFEL